jgi:type VI protein secretion system component Hcp
VSRPRPASNPFTPTAGGGGGAGKASFSSLNMMKAVDANTAAVLSAVASGQHFPEATFAAQAAGAPTESLSLSYTAVTWAYKDATAPRAEAGI